MNFSCLKSNEKKSFALKKLLDLLAFQKLILKFFSYDFFLLINFCRYDLIFPLKVHIQTRSHSYPTLCKLNFTKSNTKK